VKRSPTAPRWFQIGVIAGGGLVGTILTPVNLLTQPIPGDVRLLSAFVISALLCLAYQVDQQNGTTFLPQRKRQVPPEISRLPPNLGSLQFGLEMGTGLQTFAANPMPHCVATLVVLAGPWWACLPTGLAFGAGRALFAEGFVRHGNPAGGVTAAPLLVFLFAASVILKAGGLM
jgi:hypothetical protein